eukprot:SAG31_NODE_5299_length_2624_cov_2.500990_1_plen_232_part_00
MVCLLAAAAAAAAAAAMMLRPPPVFSAAIIGGSRASAFNGDLSGWDTSAVTDMHASTHLCHTICHTIATTPLPHHSLRRSRRHLSSLFALPHCGTPHTPAPACPSLTCGNLPDPPMQSTPSPHPHTKAVLPSVTNSNPSFPPPLLVFRATNVPPMREEKHLLHSSPFAVLFCGFLEKRFPARGVTAFAFLGLTCVPCDSLFACCRCRCHCGCDDASPPAQCSEAPLPSMGT